MNSWFLLFIFISCVSAFEIRKNGFRVKLHATNNNFQDEEAECNSEGGEWKVPLLSVTSISSLASSDLTARDFPNIELWSNTLKLVSRCFARSPSPLEITAMVDELDKCSMRQYRARLILRFFIRQKLAMLLGKDPIAYAATASFLSPSRIPRKDLPNIQHLTPETHRARFRASLDDEGTPDCTVVDVKFEDSLLDNLLLSIFRGIVQEETRFKSTVPGIKGLLEEGKHFMLSTEGSIVENQHAFVKRVLTRLMTPYLPPFYRIFMSGIVPSLERNDPKWLVNGFQFFNKAIPGQPLLPGKQLGPWFYAPAMTSWITPPLLKFLVGPSQPNFRGDGKLGGLVVEKCKFLQESGCKGLCLHQCKVPAQEFFSDTLGLFLTVEPNFATQECQWSWGQKPLRHQDDPSWPQGCLVGCPAPQKNN